MSQTLYGFYLSFSGESATPIKNVYALSRKGETVSKAVLDPAKVPYQELRGMSFGPDGNLYVAQAYKKASAILKFSGTPSRRAAKGLVMGSKSSSRLDSAQCCPICRTPGSRGLHSVAEIARGGRPARWRRR
jgi:hypothetical protein